MSTYKVTGLVVVVQCDDGKLRTVRFDKEGRQVSRVHNFVRHQQGGSLHVHEAPVVLKLEQEEVASHDEHNGLGAKIKAAFRHVLCGLRARNS